MPRLPLISLGFCPLLALAADPSIDVAAKPAAKAEPTASSSWSSSSGIKSTDFGMDVVFGLLPNHAKSEVVIDGGHSGDQVRGIEGRANQVYRWALDLAWRRAANNDGPIGSVFVLSPSITHIDDGEISHDEIGVQFRTGPSFTHDRWLTVSLQGGIGIGYSQGEIRYREQGSTEWRRENSNYGQYGELLGMVQARAVLPGGFTGVAGVGYMAHVTQEWYWTPFSHKIREVNRYRGVTWSIGGGWRF